MGRSEALERRGHGLSLAGNGIRWTPLLGLGGSSVEFIYTAPRAHGHGRATQIGFPGKRVPPPVWRPKAA
eukprot:6392800-Prymnesium_polylepis.1